jgi:hypothetical protein
MKPNLFRCVAMIIPSAVVSLAVFALGDGSRLRAALVLAFLLVLPGLPFALLLRLRDALATAVTAVALSVVIDGAVPGVFVYANAWSPTAAFAVVLAIQVLGVLAYMFASLEPRRRSRPT